MVRRKSPFIEAQRYRFEHSCGSCLMGEHRCAPGDLFRFSGEGSLEPCQCGCVIEPWPWEHASED